MRARATDPGEIWWAQYEPYFDTSGLADSRHDGRYDPRAIADGAVNYLVAANEVALIPTARC